MGDIGDGEAIQKGMQAARQSKRRWSDALSHGSVTFSYVVELSRTDDGRYLGSLRLADLLAARPGWNQYSAAEAMKHHGFDLKATITSVRRSSVKVDLFDTLMQADAVLWRARPEMPVGWPFFGKLDWLEAQLQKQATEAAGASPFDGLLDDGLVPQIGTESGGDTVPEDDPFSKLLDVGAETSVNPFDELLGEDD